MASVRLPCISSVLTIGRAADRRRRITHARDQRLTLAETLPGKVCEAGNAGRKRIRFVDEAANGNSFHPGGCLAHEPSGLDRPDDFNLALTHAIDFVEQI